MPDRIINIQNVGISSICEVNGFINSFNKITKKRLIFSDIDGIFAELFKKAKLFDFRIEHLKRS